MYVTEQSVKKKLSFEPCVTIDCTWFNVYLSKRVICILALFVNYDVISFHFQNEDVNQTVNMRSQCTDGRSTLVSLQEEEIHLHKGTVTNISLITCN